MKEETIRQIVEKVINEIEKKRVSPDETCSGKLHDIIKRYTGGSFRKTRASVQRACR